MDIDYGALPGLVDVTSIAANTTADDVRFTACLAKAYGCAAVSVNPCWLSLAISCLKGEKGIRRGATASFPFGCELTSVKIYAATQVALSGAQEIDMVMNVGAFLSGDEDLVRREIELVMANIDCTLKVIVEAALLNDAQLARATSLVAGAGAHFVKSDTGLYGKPITPERIRIMCEAAAGRARVKASGGIRTLDALVALREAGADRFGIGARSALKIFREIDGRLGRPSPKVE